MHMTGSHLSEFPLERRHLFRVGEGDVQPRWDGINELHALLVSSGDQRHQLLCETQSSGSSPQITLLDKYTLTF